MMIMCSSFLAFALVFTLFFAPLLAAFLPTLTFFSYHFFSTYLLIIQKVNFVQLGITPATRFALGFRRLPPADNKRFCSPLPFMQSFLHTYSTLYSFFV
jgi:hypothetical protein